MWQIVTNDTNGTLSTRQIEKEGMELYCYFDHHHHHHVSVYFCVLNAFSTMLEHNGADYCSVIIISELTSFKLIFQTCRNVGALCCNYNQSRLCHTDLSDL